MSEIVVTLSAPINRVSKATGEIIDSVPTLTFRPLKFGDLVAAMDASAGASGSLVLHLASRSCGMPVSDLTDLPMVDGTKIMEIVSGFMPAGLPTGTTGPR